MRAQKRSSTFQCRELATEKRGVLSVGNVKTRLWKVELRRARDFLRPRHILHPRHPKTALMPGSKRASVDGEWMVAELLRKMLGVKPLPIPLETVSPVSGGGNQTERETQK